MVELDTPQLGEFALLILGAQRIVGDSYREDENRGNSTGYELVVSDGDRICDM